MDEMECPEILPQYQSGAQFKTWKLFLEFSIESFWSVVFSEL